MADAYQLETTTDRYLLEDGSLLLLEATNGPQGAMFVQLTPTINFFGPSAQANKAIQ